MQFYSRIVKKAWRITWHHKVLWIFGIFVSLWGGKGIEAELNSAGKLASETSPLNPNFWNLSNWQDTASQLSTTGGETTLYMMALLVGLLLVIVTSIIMLAQTGVIDAFAQFAAKDTTSDQYALQHAWVAGKKHFWVVLGLNLLGKAVSYGLLVIVLAPLFMNGGVSIVDVWWVLIGLLLYIPVSIVISIVTRFALNHAVLKEKAVGVSVRDGWKMFRANIGVSLELSFVMFAVFAALVIVLAPVLAAVVTLPSLVLVLANAPATFGLPWVYLHDRLFVVALLVIVYVISVLFAVWHMGTWTMLYTELSLGNRKSKAHRWARGE